MKTKNSHCTRLLKTLILIWKGPFEHESPERLSKNDAIKSQKRGFQEALSTLQQLEQETFRCYQQLVKTKGDNCDTWESSQMSVQGICFRPQKVNVVASRHALQQPLGREDDLNGSKTKSYPMLLLLYPFCTSVPWNKTRSVTHLLTSHISNTLYSL